MSKYFLKCLLGAAITVLAIVGVKAQHTAFFITKTEKDGLSDDRVTCFLKDKKNFMWIGTENGLNKYDGHEFVVYKPGFKNNLSNAFITGIAQAENGLIWVATRRGLNAINTVTDSTEIILPPENAKQQGLPNDLLWDVYPQNDSTVWVVPDSKDLVRFNPLRKIFTLFNFRKYLKESGIQTAFSYHSILKILPKSSEELWLATTDGIFIFNEKTEKFRPVYISRFDKIRMFRYDKINQKILCVEEKDTLYCFSEKSGQLKKIRIDYAAIKNKEVLPWHPFSDAAFVPSSGAIVVVNKNDSVVSVLRQGFAGSVNAVYQCRDGILWLASNKGVSWYSAPLNKNLHIKLGNNLVYDPEFAMNICWYSAGNKSWLLASYADNQVWQIDEQTGNKGPLQRPLNLVSDTIFSFFSRHPDTVYMLGRGKILMYVPSTGKWQKYLVPGLDYAPLFTCMAIDANNNWWLGTRRNGVLQYNPRIGSVWPPPDSAFAAHIIHDLKFDAFRNLVWIATHSSGIHAYSLASGKFIRIQRNDNKKAASHSSLINHFSIDRNNRLWAATLEGGSFRYESSKENSHPQIQNYNTQTALPDNNIYSVTTKSNGDIFFSTGKGIGRIDSAGSFIALYNEQSGLPYSKFLHTVTNGPGETVATITGDEFFCFNYNALHSTTAHKLLINYVTINDVKQPAKQDAQLEYTSNNIHVFYTLPEFHAAEALHYRCLLEGYDKQWIFNGNHRSIRYANLPPGSYTFKLEAYKGRDRVQVLEDNWKFTISPPFWKTNWFRIISALAIAFLLFYGQKRREKNLRKKETEKNKIKQQMTELEVKALRSQMNPHFIFNSLNAISMLVAGKQNDKGLEYLGKFSKLLRLVLDESENNLISLKDEIKMLDLYLQLESLRFGDSFYYELENKVLADEEEAMLPSFIIQPLVENAIWHGLLHKEGSRRLKVSFETAGEQQLRCIVKDNGIGIDAGNKRKSERLNGMVQKPKGLALLKERLQLLQTQFNVQTAVHIIDLYDVDGRISGTKVTIELPLKNG